MSQQTTAETNQKLSRADLFSMAIGQIIGVGIMTMTGIAIGFTGRSVNLAYLLAGVRLQRILQDLFHLMCCMADSLKLPRLQSKAKPQTLSPQFRDKRERSL